ncbi:MAG: LolA family protein [Halobacteria archaeon]
MDTKKAVAAVVLVVLVGAAVAFFLFFSEPAGTDIGERMEESYSEIDDYEGTMNVNVVQTTDREQVENETAIRQQAEALAAENESLSVEEAEQRIRDSLPESGEVETVNQTTVANVSFAKPDRYRYDYVQQPPDPRIGAVTTNNTFATVYRRGYEPEQRRLGQGDEPVVGIRFGDFVPTVTDDYEIALNETETDNEAYVLDLTPVSEFEGALDRIVVDRETSLPLRVERTTSDSDTTTRTVVEYDYAYDVGVDDSVFEVDADSVDYPEVENDTEDDNVSRVQRMRQNISETAREEGRWEVENVSRESFDFDTVDEGEDWLNETVPRADLDALDGYEVDFVRGNTVDNNSSLTVTYRNSSNTFSVYYTSERESRFADWPGEENDIFEIEEVEVGDRSATLHYYDIESGFGRSYVGYECDDLLVEVYTDNLPNDALVSAANSVGCS